MSLDKLCVSTKGGVCITDCLHSNLQLISMPIVALVTTEALGFTMSEGLT
jgi:hypothetical protein